MISVVSLLYFNRSIFVVVFLRRWLSHKMSVQMKSLMKKDSSRVHQVKYSLQYCQCILMAGQICYRDLKRFRSTMKLATEVTITAQDSVPCSSRVFSTPMFWLKESIA